MRIVVVEISVNFYKIVKKFLIFLRIVKVSHDRE